MPIEILNPEPEDRVSERHICYFTVRNDNKIALYEVIDVHYKHPQAPEHATLPRLEYRKLCEHHCATPQGAKLVLLEAAQVALYSDFGRPFYVDYKREIKPDPKS